MKIFRKIWEKYFFSVVEKSGKFFFRSIKPRKKNFFSRKSRSISIFLNSLSPLAFSAHFLQKSGNYTWTFIFFFIFRAVENFLRFFIITLPAKRSKIFYKHYDDNLQRTKKGPSAVSHYQEPAIV